MVGVLEAGLSLVPPRQPHNVCCKVAGKEEPLLKLKIQLSQCWRSLWLYLRFMRQAADRKQTERSPTPANQDFIPNLAATSGSLGNMTFNQSMWNDLVSTTGVICLKHPLGRLKGR